MPFQLSELNVDVISHILGFCSISIVLAVSQVSNIASSFQTRDNVLLIPQTCKRLYTIAAFRQVWVSLVSDLVARQMIDLGPNQNLNDLSKEGLVDLVKKVGCGPRWSSSDHAYPRIIRRMNVTLREQPPPQPGYHPIAIYNLYGLEPAPNVKLLPGGRYLFYRSINNLKLQCYDIIKDRLIWTHVSFWERAKINKYSIDIVDEGQSIMIFLTVCHTSGHAEIESVRESLPLNSPNWIGINYEQAEVVHLDLKTGMSRNVFTTSRPLIYGPSSCLTICGDYIFINMCGEQLLQNIRTKAKFVKSRHHKRYAAKFTVALIPECVIMAKLSTSRIYLGVWDVRSVIERQNLKIDTALLSEEIPTPPIIVMPQIWLSAHPSPFRDDVYIIWVYVIFYSLLLGIYKYELSLGPLKKTLRLLAGRHITSAPLKPPNSEFSISYAGHLALFDSWSQKPFVLSFGGLLQHDHFQSRLLDESQAQSSGHLSAYSRALAYCSYIPGAIGVEYYE